MNLIVDETCNCAVDELCEICNYVCDCNWEEDEFCDFCLCDDDCEGCELCVEGWELTEEELKVMRTCLDCKEDTFELEEYYMVHFDLWNRNVPKDNHNGMLCIGCLEERLGRQLTSEDFIDVPINYSIGASERFINRRGERFDDYEPDRVRRIVEEDRNRQPFLKSDSYNFDEFF